MHFTDLFIRRPVLASVVSIFILLLGLQSLYNLPVRQFPHLVNTKITVTTTYPGATAELIQGFITQPLEQAIASTEGVDYITSSSSAGISLITVYLKLGADSSIAMTDVMAKVAEQKNALPQEANDSVFERTEGDGRAIFYYSFTSDQMTLPQITEYLKRVVQPKLQTVPGVANAELLGPREYAMRVYLDNYKMAGLGVTPSDVVTALRANNYQSAAGRLKSNELIFTVNADTDIQDVDAFADLVVRADGDSLVRLQDVANIELGPQNMDSSVMVSGENAVTFAIYNLPDANPLTVIDKVREPDINSQLPPSLRSVVMYDATEYIRVSIFEVLRTLLEAAGIVVIVIFLFLGSARAVMIPMITIPLSLVGVALAMLMLGFSINLLTLLALVLAIGLVVDDAIVVLENIHRHIEEGKTPLDAALVGAREIASPVISMTLTLAAVYAPIGFLGGLTGALFREFTFTLAGAVIVSGIVALTLSPMMCSRFLESHGNEGWLTRKLDAAFGKLQRSYEHVLDGSLKYRPVTLLLMFSLLGSLYFMFSMIPSKLAPDEDQGVIFMVMTGPKTANLDYMERYSREVYELSTQIPEVRESFIANGRGGNNQGFAGFILHPWDERERGVAEILPQVQGGLMGIAGLQTAAFSLPSLPGGSGFPVEFIIKTAADYETLFNIQKELEGAAWQSGLFLFVKTSLDFDNPEVQLKIDRAKAGQLGISMQEIGNALAIMLGEGYSNRFSKDGYSYQVIPQMPRDLRATQEQLMDIVLRSASGQLVPLSNVVDISVATKPNSLSRFNQMNSATIQAVLRPGKSLGEALAFLDQKALELFPPGFEKDFMGESRQFVQEGQTLMIAFGFALLVIYLVLAAQFESWRDPIIILVTVPLSIFGALLPLFLGLGSINIYTQIGLVTLIGVISKHGILMVQFANQLREQEGFTKRRAIEHAAAIRLRPILMTTAAMVMAMMPLLVATGAGAASRFAIGLVIASGMTIGTLFTLFVVPVVYSYLSSEAHGQAISEH